MSEDPTPAPGLDEVVKASGIPYPNGPRPFTHITFCSVVWMEEKRLGKLLEYLRPHFETMIIGVQKSTDRTLEIARDIADIVIEDEHHGFGDATFGPLLLPRVQSRWTFKLDGDEWPSIELLQSMSNATWYAEHNGHDGVWVPFRSSVEGTEYEEQHNHLRLFETHLGWPAKLHSRPPAQSMVLWQEGHVRHDRGLDEMMQDYLRYWHVGRGNRGWEAHNTLMMRSACSGVAEVKGWDFVQSHSWWDELRPIAFEGETPWEDVPAPAPKKRKRS